MVLIDLLLFGKKMKKKKKIFVKHTRSLTGFIDLGDTGTNTRTLK